MQATYHGEKGNEQRKRVQVLRILRKLRKAGKIHKVHGLRRAVAGKQKVDVQGWQPGKTGNK